MKYLKYFENIEPITSYFKNKINWDLLNYMKDLTLNYSDKGDVVLIDISTNVISGVYIHSSVTTIYNYVVNSDSVPDRDEYVDMRKYKTLKTLSNPFLLYKLTIIKENSGEYAFLSTEELDTLYDKIKQKFPLIRLNNLSSSMEIYHDIQVD